MFQHIQPFELMGVTYKTPLAEVRKRYYSLAMLCHPDKGGQAQDMATLHAAFKWIEAQHLLMAQQSHHNYEEAQKSLDEFLYQHTKTLVVPSVMEVSLEASGYTLKDIDKYYDTHAPQSLGDNARSWFRQLVMRDIYVASVQNYVVSFDTVCSTIMTDMPTSWNTSMPASIPDGYGPMMLSETEGQEPTHPPSFGQRELVVYDEKLPYAFNPPLASSQLPAPSKLDNYACLTTTHKLNGYDYREAHLENYEDGTLESCVTRLCPMFGQPYPDLNEHMQRLKIERDTINP